MAISSIIKNKKTKEDKDGERGTKELIMILNSDFERLVNRMVQSAKRGYISKADESHARNLVRTLFALVEGTVYALKIEALFAADEQGRELSMLESMFVLEIDYDLNDKGEIVDRTQKIKLENNIIFAFRLCSQVFRCSNTLDKKSDWWQALKRSIHVRNRLMHPRFPSDLDMGGKEIIDAVAAQRGFFKAAMDLVRMKKNLEK